MSICNRPGCPHPVRDRGKCATHLREARSIYGRRHAQASRVTIADQPWCSRCGATRDLTADHEFPGDPMSPLRTMCRPCNSARANRMRVGLDG